MNSPAFGSSTLERYTKEKKIGRGAYGTVYKAIDNITQQVVAMKKIKFEVKSEGIPSTSLREIAILRTLVDPTVVR